LIVPFHVLYLLVKRGLRVLRKKEVFLSVRNLLSWFWW